MIAPPAGGLGFGDGSGRCSGWHCTRRGRAHDVRSGRDRVTKQLRLGASAGSGGDDPSNAAYAEHACTFEAQWPPCQTNYPPGSGPPARREQHLTTANDSADADCQMGRKQSDAHARPERVRSASRGARSASRRSGNTTMPVSPPREFPSSRANLFERARLIAGLPAIRTGFG